MHLVQRVRRFAAALATGLVIPALAVAGGAGVAAVINRGRGGQHQPGPDRHRPACSGRWHRRPGHREPDRPGLGP